MKTLAFIAFLLSLPLAGGPLLAGQGGARVQPVSYYGENDQVDLYQAGILRRFAESSVALFSDRALTPDGAGGYRLNNISLREKLNLRPGQPFGDQTVGAYCSGVLVGPDLVLTAGHCFEPDERGGPCGRVKFAFGYAVTREGENPVSFPAANVYSCREIVAQKVQDERHNFTCRNGRCTEAEAVGNGADYALVRLDRPAAGRHPLAVSREPVAQGVEVGVIGYPSGLPVKVQEKGATVRSVSRDGYFVTNLDTFRGSSGSPVFNMRTLKIEGIIVRGGTDYIYGSTAAPVNDPSRPYLHAPGEANYYPQDGGRGEDVSFLGEVQALIPASEAERALDYMLEGGRNQVQTPAQRPVPAIYTPGDGGGRVQPAIYTPPDPGEPVPTWI